ncbi:MAG: adenylosuccinate lyase [Acidobacteriota bacterium]|nr:adenylosuccinate lyase [Blastocatellia bacterium]MDW8239882.1 adenylosuccinate lyase [Acidobacteriota bacterium]
MIPRYTLPQMGRIWTEENKFRTWLDVEIAVCEAQAEMGMIPAEAVHVIKQKAAFDVTRIHQIEQTVRHDVIAFLTNVAEYVGPEARFIHYGLTSSDVIDTANALLLKQAGALIIADLEQLAQTLQRRAIEFKHTPMVGRTHGMHAEPTTFGLKLALWYADTQRNHQRMQRALETISVGKISGAVGTFAHLDPEVEERVCARLGLKPAPISTQIIQRDRHAEFLATLAIIAACVEKIALEIRHLQRTEVGEVHEHFGEGQKGSSAMPHKRNPIICEQLCGLARLVRSNLQASLENVALWHERDISHSSVERVIFADSCILTDYLLQKVAILIDKLVVHPDRMRKNMDASRGLIFSGALLLALTQAGLAREEAYRLVQQCAMRALDEGEDFRQLVLADPEITAIMPPQQIERVFDLNLQLRNVDKIFARVFQREKA